MPINFNALNQSCRCHFLGVIVNVVNFLCPVCIVFAVFMCPPDFLQEIAILMRLFILSVSESK